VSIIVDLKLCTGCETCIDSCPYDAIEIVDEKAVINEYCQFCNACIEACPEGAIKSLRDGPEADTPAEGYKGVWVFAEQGDCVVANIAYELLGAGRKLADTLGVKLSAVLMGAPKTEAEKLIHHGADNVYLCEDKALEKFNDEPYAGILSLLIQKHKPEIVLAGATAIGRSFIPRIAARLKTGLTADCTSLEIEEGTKNLLQVRPAFGGNIMASILCPGRRPQIATVRHRVMKAMESDTSRSGEIIEVNPGEIKSRTKVLETVKESSETSVNLQEAQVIVSGGRGLGDEKGFGMLLELAELLDGTLGASRAAVDEGWIPYRHQVGQTGKTVCPKIYIACGISGAVQHLVGMQSSDVIIAINKNPDAPIFSVATFGIVGDIFEIVPLLVKKLNEARG
jgi:electron transfer flavoprotein alpha subunit